MLFYIVNDLICFLPEIFFGFISCALVFFYSLFSVSKLDFVCKTFIVREVSYWVSVQLVFFTLLLLSNNPIDYITLFFGSLYFDFASYLGKVALFCFILFVFFIAHPYLKTQKINSFEFFLLVLLASFGLLIILQSNDFLSFYLSLELQSLCFYALASFKRDSSFSVEAGLKYFILGAFSSGIFLFGCTIVYGTTGSTNFSVFYLLFSNGFHTPLLLSSLIGFVFILVGFFFKITAAPFHMWAPDVYEGSPTFVSFYFAVIPKIALFFVFIRVVFSCFYSWLFIWSNFLLFSACASLFVGALGAFSQRKIKRFLVYSSVSHVGYMFLGLSTGSLFGLSSVFFYLFIYICMVFGIWSFFFCLFTKKSQNSFGLLRYLEDYRFLSQENPMLSLVAVTFLFSIAGIPPLAGFYSKIFVFFAASAETALFAFLFFTILISIVGSLYYLRMIKIISFEVVSEVNCNKSKLFLFSSLQKKQALLLSFCFIFISFFCFSPGFLFMLSHRLALCFIGLIVSIV
jgi:NADH-quinone oxidoreductase subunit N